MNQIVIGILNNAWASSLFIVAVILVRLMIKKAPKWIPCALWGLVAVRLLLPFRIESVLSLVPSAAPIPSNIEYSPVPHIDSGIPIINQTMNPMLESSLAPQPVTSVNPLQILLFVAGIVWIAGMVGMLAYALISYVVLRRKVAASKELEKNVFVCDDIVSPFILGIIRPGIYLPSGLSAMARECVLEHERAHLKRRDHFWKPFGFGILSIYWFHPLCWIAYILLCKDIELACDEKVTRDKDKQWKADYCQALLDCNVKRRLIVACPVAFGEVSVKDRVKLVLNYKKPAFWVIVAAIVISAVTAVCFMTSPKENKNLLTLDKLEKICNSAEWTRSQAVEGIEYWKQFDNLKMEENRIPGAVTSLYRCEFEKNGTVYELQISFWPKWGDIESVLLYNMEVKDCIRLYTGGTGTTDTDITGFLSRKYDILSEIGVTSVTCSKLKSPVSFEKYEMELFLNFSGNMFVAEDYDAPKHGNILPKSWWALGGVGVCPEEYCRDLEVFADGRLTEYQYHGNHMSSEKVMEFTTSRFGGCLYEYELELFTATETSYGTSRYWVAFFTEGPGKPVYMMYFNRDYFSREEVLKNIGPITSQTICGQIDKNDLVAVDNLFGEKAYRYSMIVQTMPTQIHFFYDSNYEPLVVAYGDDYYLVDLDGDGKNELIENMFFPGDGGRATGIYTKKDGKLYHGFGDSLLDEEYDYFGVGCEFSYYIPKENVVEIYYWKEELQDFKHKKYSIDLSKIEMWEYDSYDDFKGKKVIP